MLAEALTTYGTALARTGQYEMAQATLQRAAEVAETAGDKKGAGHARLTLVEELGPQLPPDKFLRAFEDADYLLSDSQNPEILSRLLVAARRIIADRQHQATEFNTSNFIYGSEKTGALLQRAHRIASSTTSAVLISGETGTGKEVLARLLHEWSGRTGQYIILNCAALPDTLIESQLFGHRKGSFTGATKDHPGAARAAVSGTLFLDEIAELSASNQAKLLRLIDTGEIMPIGAATPEKVDVRIIAATNRQLPEEVAQGRFREDLFYRLQTFHIEIPPLRERPEDIAALAAHFIQEARERHRKYVKFTPEAVLMLQDSPLRGNARELRTIIERTVLFADEGATITSEIVRALAFGGRGQAQLAAAPASGTLEEEVLRFEGELIRQALAKTDGKITHAARLLGLSHQALDFMLKGRHKDLIPARKPARVRRRSLIPKTQAKS